MKRLLPLFIVGGVIVGGIMVLRHLDLKLQQEKAQRQAEAAAEERDRQRDQELRGIYQLPPGVPQTQRGMTPGGLAPEDQYRDPRVLVQAFYALHPLCDELCDYQIAFFEQEERAVPPPDLVVRYNEVAPRWRALVDDQVLAQTFPDQEVAGHFAVALQNMYHHAGHACAVLHARREGIEPVPSADDVWAVTHRLAVAVAALRRWLPEVEGMATRADAEGPPPYRQPQFRAGTQTMDGEVPEDAPPGGRE